MGSRTERAERPRAHGDHGAALVEFALVMVLLFSMIFGIIHYGLILSFKQDVTRAAAEGARAGAVAFPATTAEAAAIAATNEAVEAFGGSEWSAEGCSRDGMACNVSVDPCPSNALQTCVTVELFYDYDGEDPAACGNPASPPDRPLFGSIPILGGLTEPNCVSAKAVARTNA